MERHNTSKFNKFNTTKQSHYTSRYTSKWFTNLYTTSWQPSVPVLQPQQPSPVAPQEQSLLFQPQHPRPNTVSKQQQFTQPHVNQQASPIRQPRQESSIRTQVNLSAHLSFQLQWPPSLAHQNIGFQSRPMVRE